MHEKSDTTQQVGLDIPTTMERLLEALLFAAREPLTLKQMRAICEVPSTDGRERIVTFDEVEAAVQTLNEQYHREDRPYRIVAIAEGYQFVTLPEYAHWIGRLEREQARRKLSQSALETLAIIAYKQPVSRPEIEAIRGVNCDYVLRSLLEKDLVTITARAETVGRPLLYGTTRGFLQHFGLHLVTDLPRPREIEEILGESQFETERRMLEAQAGAEQIRKEEEDFKSRLPHIPKKKPALDDTAKIVPHRRQHRITVKPADPAQIEMTPEARAPESVARQEALPPLEAELPAEPSAPVVQAEIAPPVAASEQTTALPAPEVESEPPPVAEAIAEAALAAPPPIPEEIPPPVQEKEPAIDAPPVRAEDIAEESVEQDEVPGVGRLEEGETKSRWQRWKERFRTLIHRLFG